MVASFQGLGNTGDRPYILPMASQSTLKHKQTKMMCTIGPATFGQTRLRQLIEAGMDIARINASHISHADMRDIVRHIRILSEDINRPIGILLDLQGPKLRLDQLNGDIRLTTGEIITLGHAGSHATLPTQIDLSPYLEPNNIIYVGDGVIKLKVISVDNRLIHVRVQSNGTAQSNQGLNVPHIDIPHPPLNTKDQADVEFGVSLGVDFMAMSFVERAADIDHLRHVLHKLKSPAKVIAKIERQAAVDHIEAIIDAADGIMVARGDLALEVGLEDVPSIQQDIIDLARGQKKPVIIATQMLESMIHNLTPTRAEVSDVATAVTNQVDAVMLSAETAIGLNPVLTAKTMQRIILRQEQRDKQSANRYSAPTLLESGAERENDVLAIAAASLAEQTKAELLVIGTASGYTALAVAAVRPNVPVIACSHDEYVYRQMALTWGIQAHLMPKAKSADEYFAAIMEQIRHDGDLKPGDQVIIASGFQPGSLGSTNVLKIHTIG